MSIYKRRTIDRTMFYHATPEIFKRAKELRENLTLAEKKLWENLHNSKLKGFRFKAQHPVGKYIADFYCHAAQLIIEIDGEYHSEYEKFQIDKGRTAELENLNITVIRFTNDEVLNNIEKVLETIDKAVLSK